MVPEQGSYGASGPSVEIHLGQLSQDQEHQQIRVFQVSSSVAQFIMNLHVKHGEVELQ